jgi:hypothetical protein
MLVVARHHGRRCRRRDPGRRRRTATSSGSTGSRGPRRLPGDDAPYPAENYLLVGSDTREGFDPDSPDSGVVGMHERRRRSAQRHDHDPAPGAQRRRRADEHPARPVGRDRRHRPSQRINAAYNDGPRAAGGHGHPVARDPGPPLRRGRLRRVQADRRRDRWRRDLRRVRGSRRQQRPRHPAGLQHLDGTMALAYARSRYYQEWIDGDWVSIPAPTSAASSASSSSSGPPSTACCSRRWHRRRSAPVTRSRRGRVGAHRPAPRSDPGRRDAAPCRAGGPALVLAAGGERPRRRCRRAPARRRRRRTSSPTSAATPRPRRVRDRRPDRHHAG